ncbi:MAG: VPLPA-CTERM-specific exosortase XrtD [Proteobacteria bacterium]|nr:VPLPA-CTERM-specific exosortase XrtD [Pseudomonadota bacterium]
MPHDNQTPLSSMPQRLWLGSLVLALATTLFTFSSHFGNLFATWQTDEYSHGPLIPFLALFIGAHRLAERKPTAAPSLWGLPVLFGGFLFLVLAHLSAFEPPAHYGLLLSLIGLSLAFIGRAATWALAPAFLYLVFALPLPRLTYVELSTQLQLVSSHLGVWPLKILGLSVYQEGNVIDLGGYKLQVVEACNGLRYLFPLMSFGYLIALLYQGAMWKRFTLFFSTIPIAIGMNALRIAVIGITVNWWGNEMARGFLHDFEGWTVFGGCLLLLFAEAWALQKIGKRGDRLSFDYIAIPRGPFFSTKSFRATPSLLAFFLSTFFALTLAVGFLDERKETIPQHPPFFSFPLTFDGWHGTTKRLESDVLRALSLSDYLLISYRREVDQNPTDLYIAYYNSQRVGTSIHSPRNCLPGNGWQIAAQENRTLDLPDGSKLPVTRLLIKQGEATMLVYYWLDQRGRIMNDQYEAKWFLLVDSIRLHRTDGALVRLSTPLAPFETEQAADGRIEDLIHQTYPRIRQFLPGR